MIAVVLDGGNSRCRQGPRAKQLGKERAIQLVQLVSPFVDSTSSEKLAVQPEKANADGIF